MQRGAWQQRHWTAPARALFLFVLALALAVQALLVGAHRHEPVGRNGAAVSRTMGHHDAHGCAICEIQRVCGHYLPAADAAAVLAVVAAWVVGRRGGHALPGRVVSVGWRSRAPPTRAVIAIA